MRNPAWTREELILALDLYFRIDFPNASENHPEIANLSATLRKLPFHAHRGANFRNCTGIYMKLCNFLRFDSCYKGAGLVAGSKLDKAVWDEFAYDKARLTNVASSILNKYKLSRSTETIGHLKSVGTGRSGMAIGCESNSYSSLHSIPCNNREAELQDVEIKCSSNEDNQLLANGDTMNQDENLTVNDGFSQIIIRVLRAHFPNGFRIDSPIELMRFRRFAAKYYTTVFTISDEELKRKILDCGKLFDGKVYIVGQEIVNRIREEVDRAVLSGSKIIFYESFYELHNEWLFAGSVISDVMLKGLVVKLFPQYNHKQSYFSVSPDNISEFLQIKSELIRVWGSNSVQNSDCLSSNLPYIPSAKIKYVLARSSEFIRNAANEYIQLSKVGLTEEECSAITDYVVTSCCTNGYASLSNLPVDEIALRNTELTSMAIQNAVFEIVLADEFNRFGKIITPKGSVKDVRSIIENHCCTLDKCTIKELQDFERELTGGSSSVALEVAYSKMVRVDLDNFVSDKYVQFNSTEVDEVLSRFITGDYAPLRSITTFAAFPYCGQAWNLFLLESYCRRFSGRFRLESPSYNSSNIGAIVRKRCRLSYGLILADAIAKSNTPLEKEAAIDFLYSSGYIGRRSYAKINELLNRAKSDMLPFG